MKNKRLQILVTHYRESEEVIKPLLDSIAIQQNVDFDAIGVIICHDGEDIPLFDWAWLNEYPFDIEQVAIKHGGVSAARNGALDAAEAEYVMWCDSDDMFFNACGLWVFFRDEKDNEFDAFVSTFLEETRAADTGNTVYLIHSDDTTFVHGKIYRRQYLVDNNIRWNDALTVHEDSYFNTLALTLAENAHSCPTAFYLWKWRDDSICRHDPKYMLKTYRNLIESEDALIMEFRRRDKTEKEKLFVTSGIFDAYYTMNKPDWVNQENKEYRDSTERRFAAYYRKYKNVWESVGLREKMAISNRVRAKSVYEGMGMETITIEDWLRHIEALA